MKNLITLAILTAVAISIPVAAYGRTAQPTDASQNQCSDEAKTALYDSFVKNRKDDQAKAYEDAKKYLACPVGEVTEAKQKIIDYLKTWTGKYDDAARKNRLTELLYNEKKYPEAYSSGADILKQEPENLKVLVHLGANGYFIVNNQALAAQALDYARRALQQLESGKNLDDWQPLANRDAAIAYLNFTVGTLTVNTDPGNALKNFMKAVEFETPLKKSPHTYAFIAAAYETGDYAKQAAEYKDKFAGKDETPESKLALANLNQIVDRMIDGYARAVALAGNDPNLKLPKSTWSESLTTWYKFRNNNSDAGMQQLVDSILSKPLPPLPTPLTTPPQ